VLQLPVHHVAASIPITPERRNYFNHARKTRSHYNNVSLGHSNSTEKPIPWIQQLSGAPHNNLGSFDKHRNWIDPYKNSEKMPKSDQKTLKKNKKNIEELYGLMMPPRNNTTRGEKET